MVHFAEINQALPPYSMLQYIRRAEMTKLLQRTCLRYLQTTLIMGEGGLVSEFMWEIAWRNKWKIKESFEKPAIFFILNALFLMFRICQMVFWLTGLLLDHFDPQKNWSVEIMGRYNGFLSFKVNILSIQSVLFSWHAILLVHR